MALANELDIFQLFVLEILGNDRVEDAIKFTDFAQVDALKTLGNDRVEDALKFTNGYQVDALKTLGGDSVEDALKFTKFTVEFEKLKNSLSQTLATKFWDVEAYCEETLNKFASNMFTGMGYYIFGNKEQENPYQEEDNSEEIQYHLNAEETQTPIHTDL